MREGLLDAGREAALELEQWETALAFNYKCVEYMKQRGADEVLIARTRFNEYGALLRLLRYREARDLLDYCRAIFEGANALDEQSAVYGALADLEYMEGRPASAVRFVQTALRYSYQLRRPVNCAISHHNLAIYTEHSGGAADAVLAHRLAASLIYFQISSGTLPPTIRSLALSPLPSKPPSFADVCTIVDQVSSVRFQQLFAQLPKRARDGDATIQMVWAMVQDE